MAGNLTLEEFELMTAVAANAVVPGMLRSAFAQCPVIDAQAAIKSLEERGLLVGGAVSEAGYDALEPYRVGRAVLMAAGFGSRLMPITYNTPKPLARVNGTRIIDTLLDAVMAAGIAEVYVVVGYLAEQFDVLAAKYPGIRFVENPLFDSANNVSSVYAARDYLANAYIIESDLLLRNGGLITPYQYCSNYLGVPTAVTDDWCFKVVGGYIDDLLVGGSTCHHMFGISYWSEEDGRRLGRDVARAMQATGGNELYWDEVALRFMRGEYQLRVRECSFDDVVEIDTYEELAKLDSAYSRLGEWDL